MKKLFLIENSELFQGEKYIKRNKSYFEGWYFKNSNKQEVISFIPGISIKSCEKCAFIQVITNNSSYYVDYNINEFSFSYDPFYIKIGDNYFSMDSIHIDINDSKQDLYINGDIEYSKGVNINTSFLNPNIMGPFSYITFMECNHAILNMKNNVNGKIKINNNEIIFNDGIGYMEKDWGSSFPKSYIWCQGNEFKKADASFMISVANIPFKVFSFKGFICSLIIDGEEFRFATYNNAKLVKYDVDNDSIDIVLKKNEYLLHIKSKSTNSLKLIAPVEGEMKKNILESISSSIEVTLKKNNNVVFSDTSRNCGLEIVYN